ncbi:MAG TPA: hypothetical protein DD490_00155 [Acidobacteria bacterium]|nr:hypothetical protein [Acidobacteriota bacterium]
MGAAITLLASAVAAQAADQEVCLRYPVETVDSGLGVDFEDYYAVNDEVWPYWKARGAAYQVLDPDTMDVIQQGYASNLNGCFLLPEADVPAGGKVAIAFYLDSLILDHIRVRTRSGTPTSCNDDPFADHSGEADYCKPIVCTGLSGVLSGPGKKYFDIPCAAAEVTLQALAAYPLYWWHHFDPAALDHDFTVTVRHADGCPTLDTPCSNAGWHPNLGGDEILVNIDDTTEHKYRQKFLVGHEVGHTLEESHQFATFGTKKYLHGGLAAYTLAGGGAACDSAGELHALTSLEYTSDAIMEGFGHFLSADAYNDHNQATGRFTYYKDDLGFPRDIRLEGQTAFNMVAPYESNRFAQRVCDDTADNEGTELDWLRFFWDLHSEGGAADGGHLSLFKLRVDAAFQGTTWTAQNGYDLLQQNVCEGEPAVQAYQIDFLAFAGSDDLLGGNGVKPTAGVPSCP